MPPKAPASSASAASKGKGKEGASTTSTSNSSDAPSSSSTTTTATNAGSTSTPSANAYSAAQRRQPIGKVIHYFADNQSQGYDGLAFQEAYKTQVLAKVQEIQDAKKDEQSEETEVEVKNEDLETFMSLTGLKKQQAQAYFTKARSSKLEDACRLYLHPSTQENGSSGSIAETKANGAADVVSAA